MKCAYANCDQDITIAEPDIERRRVVCPACQRTNGIAFDKTISGKRCGHLYRLGAPNGGLSEKLPSLWVSPELKARLERYGKSQAEVRRLALEQFLDTADNEEYNL